jgi:hypothetical protein
MDKTMDPTDVNILSNVLNAGSPFGPASADDLQTLVAAQNLYDGHNEIYQVLKRTEPVFIIGRRGSGKTATLRSQRHSGDAFAVELDSPDLITQVGNTTKALGLTLQSQFTEHTVRIWNACFTAAICARLWSRTSRINRQDAPDAFEFGKCNDADPTQRATTQAGKFLLAVRKRAAEDFATVSSLLDETELNGVPLWVARQSFGAAARAIDWRPVVSMDSLDQYPMYYQGGSTSTPEAVALQGLFRAASATGRSDTAPYRVRVSFPAELWHYYLDLSSNPLKDFENCLLLHWNSKELIHIAATRLRRYLEISDPGQLRKLDVSESHMKRGRWATDFLRLYLPPSVTNRLGTLEPTMPYLLRHTQLLPRHFILILNKVFSGKSIAPNVITEKDVVNGVAEAEAEIVNGVIDSFEVPYPHLRDVCEGLIPRLPLSFPETFLHSIADHSNKFGMEYREVLRMLVETGAVGRRTEASEYYIRGDFEYLHINRLLMTDDDELCLHPLFAVEFDSKVMHDDSPESTVLPIFPLGSDPTREDFTRYVHLTRYDESLP